MASKAGIVIEIIIFILGLIARGMSEKEATAKAAAKFGVTESFARKAFSKRR